MIIQRLRRQVWERMTKPVSCSYCHNVVELEFILANATTDVPDILKFMGLTVDVSISSEYELDAQRRYQGVVHNIELGSLSEGSDGHDSMFSHATSLSEVEIDRRMQESGAGRQ